jgi:hypothetical protein
LEVLVQQLAQFDRFCAAWHRPCIACSRNRILGGSSLRDDVTCSELLQVLVAPWLV